MRSLIYLLPKTKSDSENDSPVSSHTKICQAVHSQKLVKGGLEKRKQNQNGIKESHHTIFKKPFIP